MRRKITIFGVPETVAGHREQADEVYWPSSDAAGADVVVVGWDADLASACDFVCRRAPAAVVLVTDPARCEEILQRTNFPRARVIAAHDLLAVIDAVLAASGAKLDVVVCHDGEQGRHGFHPAQARIGAGGVLAIDG